MRLARFDLFLRAFVPRNAADLGPWRRAGAVLAIAAAALSFAALVRAETVNSGAIAAAARRSVQEAFGPGVEVETQCGLVPAIGPVQGADAEIRVRVLGDRRQGGPVPVVVEFWQDGERLGECPVTVHARLYRQVLVAREPIGRGVALLPELFTIERREVAVPGSGGAAVLASVAGMRLRRPVPAGETVLAADLEPLPVVRRGDRVTATVDVGGITVIMSAVALEDGAAGAAVMVKNDRSGRRLQAVVAGPGAVRVQLDNSMIGG